MVQGRLKCPGSNSRYGSPRAAGLRAIGLFVFAALAALAAAAHSVHHLDEGHEHGNDDAPDDDGQEDDHDGFEQGGHGRHGVIHLLVVVLGDLQEHFRQGAGLFADVHHADDHGREDAGSFERRSDGFALFDTLMDGVDGVGDDDIAGGFFDNGEGLEDGNAAADERAEGTGKARDGDLADDRADDGHLEFELVKGVAAKLGADEKHEGDDQHGYHTDGDNGVVLDCVADGEHEAGEGGELGAFQHAGEHFLELGNDIYHQNAKDGNGDEEHGDGVKHGRDDLALDLLGLLHEFRQAVKHDFEDTAQFSRLDHVDEEPVENFGMLGQALGEGAATLDCHCQLADN